MNWPCFEHSWQLLLCCVAWFWTVSIWCVSSGPPAAAPGEEKVWTLSGSVQRDIEGWEGVVSDLTLVLVSPSLEGFLFRRVLSCFGICCETGACLFLHTWTLLCRCWGISQMVDKILEMLGEDSVLASAFFCSMFHCLTKPWLWPLPLWPSYTGYFCDSGIHLSLMSEIFLGNWRSVIQ